MSRDNNYIPEDFRKPKHEKHDVDPLQYIRGRRKCDEISTALYTIANAVLDAQVDATPFRELIERALVERWLGETLSTDDNLLLALAAIDDPRSISAIEAWLALPVYPAKPAEYGEVVLRQLKETAEKKEQER